MGLQMLQNKCQARRWGRHSPLPDRPGCLRKMCRDCSAMVSVRMFSVRDRGLGFQGFRLRQCKHSLLLARRLRGFHWAVTPIVGLRSARRTTGLGQSGVNFNVPRPAKNLHGLDRSAWTGLRGGRGGGEGKQRERKGGGLLGGASTAPGPGKPSAFRSWSPTGHTHSRQKQGVDVWGRGLGLRQWLMKADVRG